MKQVVKETMQNPYAIAVTLLGLLGTGGFGAFKGLTGAEALGDRMDVVIYLMCDKKQSCVDSSWNYIALKAMEREIKAGGNR